MLPLAGLFAIPLDTIHETLVNFHIFSRNQELGRCLVAFFDERGFTGMV